MNLIKHSKVLMAIVAFLTSTGAWATSATFTANNVCQGNAISFNSTSTSTNGTITSYAWDFTNDGTTDAVGASTQYVYPTHGTFDVRLTITTSTGFVATTVNSVTVHPNPQIAFTHANNCLGDTTQFNASATIATGAISSYAWEFTGNSMYDDGSGMNTEFRFIAAGYYNASLKVTSDKGCVSTVTNSVAVAPKPQAAFEVTNVCMGEATEFTNNTTIQGGTVSYVWVLPNNDTLTSTHVSKTMTMNGNYMATLHATSDMGCTDAVSKNFDVYAQPQVDFTAANVCLGNAMVFENTSATNGATIANYFWDFGDGNQQFTDNQMQENTFAEVGMYNVTLAAYTASGCVDTTAKMVEVYANPVANITASAEEICDGSTATLYANAPANSIFAWGNGSQVNERQVTKDGLYSVVYINNRGCMHRDSIYITVFNNPELSISPQQVITIGESTEIEATGGIETVWNGGSLTNVNSELIEVAPTSETVYYATITDENNCKSSGEVTVKVIFNYNFTPATVFTPDANGKNDRWEIWNIENFPTCAVTVYDANGNIVYHTASNYSNDFDGKFNGYELPQGTYYYLINCDDSKKIETGFVDLIRANR